MPRKKKIRQELLDTGTLQGANGVELARFDMEDGTYIINERALYRYLLMGSYYGSQTPLSKINMVFGMTGGWTFDPVVRVVLFNMEALKLIEMVTDKNGKLVAVKPLATAAIADKKLPKYEPRKDQFAGLTEVEEE